MAYFPNGTSGMIFEEEHCANCIHDTEEKPCSILLIHNLYNYDQCDDTPAGKAIKSILELLIPTAEGGLHSDECSMFHDASAPEPDDSAYWRAPFPKPRDLCA